MRPPTLVVLALVGCSALQATTVLADQNGGLDLSAQACNTGLGASRDFFVNCADGGGTPYPLFGCFQVTTTQDSFVSMEAVLDLLVNDPGLPDWWHFESGG